VDFKHQKFLILGISKSGSSATEFLLRHGAKCYIYEELKIPKVMESIERLITLGAVKAEPLQIDRILPEIDVVVMSPGIPINHEIAVKAKNAKKRIIGELELGFASFNPVTVAVTGTNGKTTTVSLIDAILESAGIKKQLVGNVGIPVTKVIDEAGKDDIYVAEVSSFQLETVSSFAPHIACVLNISPDHLERHYTFENYVFLKKRIFQNQRESEYAILNFDDPIVKGFAEEIKSKPIFVSLKERTNGGYEENGKLYYKGEYILDRTDLALSGEHNVYNALFAVCACKLLGVNSEDIREGLIGFKGIKHRMELIAEKGGIRYYNDSKSTNTASAITAIKSMDRPTVLILGGSEKGEKYDGLFKTIKASLVKHTVITGASRYAMLGDAGKIGYINLTVTPDFENAVEIAMIIAKEGDNVLLSPACASFDSFSGFEERGEKFAEIVEKVN